MLNPRHSKYGNKKIEINGYKFDSLAEGKRYQDLKSLQAAKLISELCVHPRYVIEINGVTVCSTVLDFYYWDKVQNKGVYEDVKGHFTAMSRLKHKLFEAYTGKKVSLIWVGRPRSDKRREKQ